ncbi:LysR family transcriptional regulator [Verrucomicrobium spinosum]|uniref:LysR family transcriptional regulator n=1 Tax=Verrucomicrobium spinosum TaxID=2736 RepID=UPI000B1D5549|nr:LysR family transcriptional regulator [Verrucomicrobium spinosum]
MEFYHLRTFLTVADEGHLTRAAEKLMTSQPAVSAQLRALEDEVGMKLFERTSKGMVLTSAGRSLREQAERIVEAAKDFKCQADASGTRSPASWCWDSTIDLKSCASWRFWEISPRITPSCATSFCAAAVA